MPENKVDSIPDFNLDDLIIDLKDTTTVDINIAGAADSMYNPYIYTGGGTDTITLTGMDDLWRNNGNGDLMVKGDINVDGVSLKDWMETVNKRLSILEPKQELLEKYAALQQAYEHYKTLEALLHNADKTSPPS